tara:strand:- start:540 stop:1142 length:603 start_codon:yes stop_codon:yes gene_type:complete
MTGEIKMPLSIIQTPYPIKAPPKKAPQIKEGCCPECYGETVLPMKQAEANKLIAQIEEFSDQQITTMFKSMVGFELTPSYKNQIASPNQKEFYTLKIDYNNHDTIFIRINGFSPKFGITPFQKGQMDFLSKIHNFIKTLSKGEDIKFFKNIEFNKSSGTIEISSANKKLETLIANRDEGLAFKRSHNKSTLKKVLDCTLS